MNRVFAWIGLVASASFVALGCGPAAPVAVSVADAPSPPASSVPSPWHMEPVLGTGLSIAFPGAPMPFHRVNEEPAGSTEMTGLVFSDVATKISLGAFRVGVIGGAGTVSPARAITALTSQWKHTGEKTPVTMGALTGMEARGTNEQGEAAIRVFGAGVWGYVLKIESETTLDPLVVDAFFESARFELPWRVEVFRSEMATVAMPATAGTGPRKEISGRGWVQTYLLQEEPAFTYVVGVFDVPADLVGADPERVLERSATMAGNLQGAKIDRLKRIELDGLVGNEIRVTTEDGVVTGGRTFVAGGRVFTFFASTADPALLDAEVTTKYLESIRLGAAP